MIFTCTACKGQTCTLDMPFWTLEGDYVYPECPLTAQSDWRHEGMPDDAPPHYDYRYGHMARRWELAAPKQELLKLD